MAAETDSALADPADSRSGLSVVRGEDLQRRYGEGDAAVDALAGVDVSFGRGELAAIIGPSGSGKSTLMHLLAGLDSPTGGKAWINDTDITNLDDDELTELRRDHIGFIFQFFNLVPVLTAEENVALPLTIAGRKPDQVWIDELLEKVGLSDRRDHRPSELSGGQQQRVAVARALVTKPTVVFADEPTGNLDSETSAEVMDLLRRSVSEMNQTVVMVTHDPRVASYADRVIVLRDGKVTADRPVSGADEVIQLMQVS